MSFRVAFLNLEQDHRRWEQRRRLVAGADADPNANADAGALRHGLGDNGKSVVQTVYMVHTR